MSSQLSALIKKRDSAAREVNTDKAECSIHIQWLPKYDINEWSAVYYVNSLYKGQVIQTALNRSRNKFYHHVKFYGWAKGKKAKEWCAQRRLRKWEQEMMHDTKGLISFPENHPEFQENIMQQSAGENAETEQTENEIGMRRASTGIVLRARSTSRNFRKN